MGAARANHPSLHDFGLDENNLELILFRSEGDGHFTITYDADWHNRSTEERHAWPLQAKFCAMVVGTITEAGKAACPRMRRWRRGGVPA